MGIWWQSAFIVQVHWITGRHTGNCKLDTNIKEMAALSHQKVLYFDFQLPNFRYLLFTLSIKFVMICIPGIRNSVGPLNQLLM